MNWINWTCQFDHHARLYHLNTMPKVLSDVGLGAHVTEAFLIEIAARIWVEHTL